MCTVAAIVALLGYMPPRGTEIVVPRSRVDTYTISQQATIKRCANRYGIKWRIDEAR